MFYAEEASAMFLKQLKLSGFKSFVEPTVIPLAKSLIGVVGPNGCGKSNLIDAVRWVMGESSAKSLRGEAMTDVIFNGSTTRKPQGQALVELLFDNSLGRLVGQYGAYQEIAVKRVVSRDGESSYFLNGTRCRRRDITDLFLGTGAGVRGYAIIGQGTISRLIEARPDELRVYLEEAAGVSKYKERRKETCQRITQTRENLARVADIRLELDNYLQRLEGQAHIASQYHALKTEEQEVKAIVLILKQRAGLEEKIKCTDHIALLEKTIEQHQVHAAKAWQESVRLKEQWHQSHAIYQHHQALFYEHKTDIARLEETLKQLHRDISRLQTEAEQMKVEHVRICGELERYDQQYVDCEAEIAPLQQAHETLLLTLTQYESTKKQVDITLELATEAFYANEKRVQQALHEQTRASMEIKHHQQRLHELQLQMERMDQEYGALQSVSEDDVFDLHEQAIASIQNDLASIEMQIENKHALKNRLRTQKHAIQQAIQDQQCNIRKIATSIATLQATLDTVLGKQAGQSVMDPSNGQHARRIVENLQVETKWQAALEMVLGMAVRGFIVDDLADVLPRVSKTLSDELILTHPSNATRHQIERAYPRLVDRISGEIPELPVNLHRIYIAESLDQALMMRNHLDDEDSVLTSDGCWLSRNWFFSKNFKTSQQVNILAKQAELTSLMLSHQAAEQIFEQMQAEDIQLQQSLIAEEHLLDELQKSREVQRALQHEHTTALARKKEKAQQQALRLKALEVSREESLDKLEALHEQQQDLILKRETAESQLAAIQQAAHDVDRDLTRAKTAAANATQSLEMLKQQIRTNELVLQKLTLHRAQYQQDIALTQQKLETITTRLGTIQTTLEHCRQQALPTQNDLHDKMNLIVGLEAQLVEQQQQLEDCNQQMETYLQSHQEEEKKIKLALEKQQKARIEEQVLEDRNRHFEEALQAIPSDIMTSLKDKKFEFSLQFYLDKNLKIIENIEMLGAVNLSAIEEFERESERKNQLDSQYQDLHEALTLLEAAIDTIDRETQQRFGTTFDAVNAQFKLLFPKLFGGGRAELSLTCDNLLEAGISVTAQPPGKRNASIHLLSGGEKAMTAVALIFAIFQLNPSPFCMLDEVDAPLDDVNIARFCELVKEMSDVVQFLFITHNKVTMTLAEQLIGVTMREAGVSRIVTVDVEAAVELCHSEMNAS